MIEVILTAENSKAQVFFLMAIKKSPTHTYGLYEKSVSVLKTSSNEDVNKTSKGEHKRVDIILNFNTIPSIKQDRL